MESRKLDSIISNLILIVEQLWRLKEGISAKSPIG
jgi:hypothetical protein